MRSLLLCLLLWPALQGNAQRLPDETYIPSIRTIKFNRTGDPLSYPYILLNSAETLDLDFDDLDGGVKVFYYSFVLCNADWTPAQLSYFDYVKGYTQVRISTYRNSSVSLQKYTHYQARIPDRSCMPIKSGNYLLKVFLNGDTSKIAFTKRMLVVDPKVDPAVQILQPYRQEIFQTHHRFNIQLDTRNMDVRYPQQQMQLKVLQNFRWDNMLQPKVPTFMRQTVLEYSNEQEMSMPAGKEFRWLNLRSFRLLGDRILRQQNSDSSYVLFVKEDLPRAPKQYFYYRDLNGMFINETVENINPLWNADYATVKFYLRPPGSQPYSNGIPVIVGELTNFGKLPEAVMQFNAERGLYEAALNLKQGYYDYHYELMQQTPSGRKMYASPIEQDTWETENNYMVLVYFRALGGRYDELIGFKQINSQFNTNFR